MAQVDIVAIPASSKYAIVEDLHLRRSYQHGGVGRILRHWDARNMKTREFMGIVLLLDEKISVIHRIIPAAWAETMINNTILRLKLPLARDSNLNVDDDGRRAMIDSWKEQGIWRVRGLTRLKRRALYQNMN